MRPGDVGLRRALQGARRNDVALPAHDANGFADLYRFRDFEPPERRSRLFPAVVPWAHDSERVTLGGHLSSRRAPIGKENRHGSQ
jgi:hypothetical protein